jgi:hypothetical protein
MSSAKKKLSRRSGMKIIRMNTTSIALCSVSFITGYLLRGLMSRGESTTSTATPITISAKKSPQLFAGIAHVDREEFAKAFDVGIPLDKEEDEKRQHVVLLYSDDTALPPKTESRLSVADATQNCDTLRLILTEPHRRRQCVALMGQWESYDIYKFMRLPPDTGGLDQHAPLRHVTRMHENDGTHPSNSNSSKSSSFAFGKYDTVILMHYLDTLKQCS